MAPQGLLESCSEEATQAIPRSFFIADLSELRQKCARPERNISPGRTHSGFATKDLPQWLKVMTPNVPLP